MVFLICTCVAFVFSVMLMMYGLAEYSESATIIGLGLLMTVVFTL